VAPERLVDEVGEERAEQGDAVVQPRVAAKDEPQDDEGRPQVPESHWTTRIRRQCSQRKWTSPALACWRILSSTTADSVSRQAVHIPFSSAPTPTPFFCSRSVAYSSRT